MHKNSKVHLVSTPLMKVDNTLHLPSVDVVARNAYIVWMPCNTSDRRFMLLPNNLANPPIVVVLFIVANAHRLSTTSYGKLRTFWAPLDT
ncbi:Os02g0817300 [Oryza sativa Japonica Group]|uniref:Os02g0817300 protein n=1 Tax=Oryza sativa subsp. japonica TaxID=39947 RepID=A0A0P0VR68_ORYSJ|nr:Os02g0817300 [Oryza sativa Japonica Group]